MTALSSAFLFAGGHLAILLAHLLPNSTFILVENKAESLQRAIERTKKLHLTNCQFFQGESTCNFLHYHITLTAYIIMTSKLHSLKNLASFGARRLPCDPGASQGYCRTSGDPPY